MSQTGASSSKPQDLEPGARMRRLVEMSHDISVDRNISIDKYFNSGKELIRAATACQLNGDHEKAFVLYLRYMTLFLEKIIQHPGYAKANKADKSHIRQECNRIFEVAEKLKSQIREKYNKEYEQDGGSREIVKRSAVLEGEPICDTTLDDIDSKFDFSQTVDDNQPKMFDPFNIEELKRSFSNSTD